jgi:hypothetical protein
MLCVNQRLVVMGSMCASNGLVKWLDNRNRLGQIACLKDLQDIFLNPKDQFGTTANPRDHISNFPFFKNQSWWSKDMNILEVETS